jgi:hypothetical protein
VRHGPFGTLKFLLPNGPWCPSPRPPLALPEGTTFGFNCDADERTWVHVIGPGGSLGCGVTREVLNTALTTLGRPAPDD